MYWTSTVCPTVTKPGARASIVCRSADSSPLNGAGPMSLPSTNTVAAGTPLTATVTSAVLFFGSIANDTGFFWPAATSTCWMASTKPSFVSLSVCLPTSIRTTSENGVLPTA